MHQSSLARRSRVSDLGDKEPKESNEEESALNSCRGVSGKDPGHLLCASPSFTSLIGGRGEPALVLLCVSAYIMLPSLPSPTQRILSLVLSWTVNFSSSYQLVLQSNVIWGHVFS